MLRRLLRLFRLPLALGGTLAGAVLIGHFLVGPDPAPVRNQFDAIVSGRTMDAPRELVFHLQDQDGAPAAGAVLVLLEPELAAAWADDDGVARLPVIATGPVRLQAYLPGHELLRARGDNAAALADLHFEARQLRELPKLEPVLLIEHDLLVLDVSGAPLPKLVIRAYPADDPEHLPWLTYSEEDGSARLAGIELRRLQLQAFSPGLPLEDPWLLAEWELVPEHQQQTEWRIQVAQLRIRGLPPGEALSGARTDRRAGLPLRRVPADGVLDYGPLPAGSYRFEVGGRQREITLQLGSNQLDF